MESNITRSAATWAGSRAQVLAFLMGAAAVGWTVVALSVHAPDPAALDPDGATDAAMARTGAAVMAAVAAVAALLWWRHRVTAHRPGRGWARAAFAVSAAHLVPVLPVIALASWGWSAPLIAFTCAVITCGVQEAAAATATGDGRAGRFTPTSG